MITFESHKNRRGWTLLEIYKDGERVGLISRSRTDIWRTGYSFGIVGKNVSEQPTLVRAKEIAIRIFGGAETPPQLE